MTQVLYAALAGPNSTSDLYTVDPVTGAMTSIGPIGFACTGLAFDPTTDFLYGSTGRDDATGGGLLISINTASGAGTLIGDTGSGQLHEIAFDASGQLWGNDSSGGLWQIDKATAVGIHIGTTGIGRYSGGLDFDTFGVLWKVGYFNGNGSIGTQSLSDGSVSFVASCSDAFPKHSGKFDGSGVFWASSPGGQGAAGTDLVTVDIATGIVTVVAAFSVPGIGGLAWGPAPGPPPLRANFTGSPLSGGAPLSVNFTDTSTPGPSGPITAWAWTFGDGGTSTVQNPTHIYTTPGHFTVTLTVTGTAPDGTATKTRTAYIHVIGPDFTPSLVPSTINVSPGVHTAVMLNTTASLGDTETITLSYTGTAGITLSFDTNPITAGDSTVVRVTIPGVISPGVYTIPIHCVGTDNSHDVTLTVHVFTVAPGFHIAS